MPKLLILSLITALAAQTAGAQMFRFYARADDSLHA